VGRTTNTKHAKSKKFEARNPKFETNPKQEIQNKYNVPNGRDRIRRFGFSQFKISLTAFVSDFDIRISDLALQGLFRSAGPLSIFGFRILIGPGNWEET